MSCGERRATLGCGRYYWLPNPKGVALKSHVFLGPPRWGYPCFHATVPRVARRALHARRSTLGWYRAAPLGLLNVSTPSASNQNHLCGTTRALRRGRRSRRMFSKPRSDHEQLKQSCPDNMVCDRRDKKNSLLKRFYANKSITGFPVVRGRGMPLLFCGSLSGTSRAW